jgi:hypothetical protein
MSGMRKAMKHNIFDGLLSTLKRQNPNNFLFFLFLSVLIFYLVLQTTVFFDESSTLCCQTIRFFYFLSYCFPLFDRTRKNLSIYTGTFCVTHFVNIVLFILRTYSFFVRQIDFIPDY